MPSKYKLSKAQLKTLFASADMLMEGRYRELYKQLGWKESGNKNFHCWNTSGHSDGVDSHASISIKDQTGQWFCHTCDIKGNFQSYWRDYIKGTALYGDHYHDFIIDFLGMTESQLAVPFAESFDDPKCAEYYEDLKKLHSKLEDLRKEKGVGNYILRDELVAMAKDEAALPMELLDVCVDRLLQAPDRMKFLADTRKISEGMIKSLRIGLDDRRRVVFPQINAEGDLLNMKLYDPWNKDRRFKWQYSHKGRETCPTPIINFTNNSLVFFGGEPDTYCAIGFGFENAVTMGAEKNTDVVNIFGRERAKQLFTGKEIVICLDTDGTGKTHALKLAHSLYPFAKQIKVINLDQSSINPFGLDPNLVHEDVTKSGKKKIKRNETDFTDFMKKNGFGDNAIKIFLELIKNTEAYTENVNRVKKTLYKVTLQESRMSMYYSPDETKELEVVAAVGEFNDSAYQYPEQFGLSCPQTGDPSCKLYSTCRKCKVPSMPEFRENEYVDFFLIRGDIPKQYTGYPGCVSVTAHEILGLIECTENQKRKELKQLCGINPSCLMTKIRPIITKKILRVRLIRDVSEYGDGIMEGSAESTSIEMDAYILGDMDIYPNRSYRLTGIQTQSPQTQHAVLYINKSEPIATSIENFIMDQEVHDMLKIFRPDVGESIEKHFDKRYEVFAHAAGVTGRKDMFLINDLAFFSSAEIDNKRLFPNLKRGWVEVLIGGDTRCCKTLISKFLMNYYKYGEMISGSSAVTRPGLMGGTTFVGGRPKVSWGKIPMNDGGCVIFDELSMIDQKTLSDLTSCRSDGVIDIAMVNNYKKAPARTAKIMLSNARAWTGDKATSFGSGMSFLKNLCFKDEILARFDIAWIVRAGDINYDKLDDSYRQPTTEFTSFQCRYLLMWGKSRRSDQYEYEKGIEAHINSSQKKLLAMFHSSTQLINQETRLKVARMAKSLAVMCYSTVEGDWEKVYVKKEHVDFIVRLLIRLYCHRNMGFDIYSKQQRSQEKLGDMRFMENIIKYIEPSSLLLEDEFSDKTLQQIFSDYLQRVWDAQLAIVDARDDKMRTTRIPIHQGLPKLINTLVARRCLIRVRNFYRKTAIFNEWLKDMMEVNNGRELSNILENPGNESDAQMLESVKKLVQDNKPDQQVG